MTGDLDLLIYSKNLKENGRETTDGNLRVPFDDRDNKRVGGYGKRTTAIPKRNIVDTPEGDPILMT